MGDLPLEIKQEPDIKLEPEDEVDTIEYEQPLNQLDGTFAVKVEKVEPNDSGDEVDEARTFSNRFNDSAMFNGANRNARIRSKSVNNEQPCPSHMETYSNGTCEVKVSHEGRIVDATKASTRKSTKIIKQTSNTRSASLSQKKQHKCSDCNYITTKSSIIKVHMRTHTGEKPFPCNSCDKRFTQKSNLQIHMKVHASKDSVHCSGCWQIFATKEEKLIHESLCERRSYECFLCRAFSTSDISQLKRHMRIHSGVRPFKCGQCSMTFTQKHCLKNHMKIHTRPRKPRCSVCSRNFLKESEKDAHEMNCNRRRYECYLCQCYKSNWKNCLQLHMRMKHTGARPFKCDSCGKHYAKQSNLNRHIKRSHPEKIFS